MRKYPLHLQLVPNALIVRSQRLRSWPAGLDLRPPGVRLQERYPHWRNPSRVHKARACAGLHHQRDSKQDRNAESKKWLLFITSSWWYLLTRGSIVKHLICFMPFRLGSPFDKVVKLKFFFPATSLQWVNCNIHFIFFLWITFLICNISNFLLNIYIKWAIQFISSCVNRFPALLWLGGTSSLNLDPTLWYNTWTL